MTPSEVLSRYPTPEERRVRLALLLGASPTRFLFRYPGHDRHTVCVITDSREEAEERRKIHAEWGATEIEEFEDLTPSRFPAFDTSLDAIAQVEARLTDEEWEIYIHHLTEIVNPSREERGTPAYIRLFKSKPDQRCAALIGVLEA